MWSNFTAELSTNTTEESLQSFSSRREFFKYMYMCGGSSVLIVLLLLAVYSAHLRRQQYRR